jgi:hypothetical protein
MAKYFARAVSQRKGSGLENELIQDRVHVGRGQLLN